MNPQCVLEWLHARGRCRQRHFDEFLHRWVRCTRGRDHGGSHEYTTFDEAVVW